MRSVFYRELQKDFFPRRCKANADAIVIIASSKRVFSQLVLAHVAPHQDRKKHPQALEVSAQINILCDWLTTRFLDQCLTGEFSPQANPIPTREQEVAVSVARHTVLSHYSKRSREELDARHHRDYLPKKDS